MYTKHKGHAIEIAKEHGSANCGIIAVGGDGTIHEVMDGLLENGKLQQTSLGLLSQGTVNAYAISADLPDAAVLPSLIAQRSFRQSALMKISDNTGKINSYC